MLGISLAFTLLIPDAAYGAHWYKRRTPAPCGARFCSARKSVWCSFELSWRTLGSAKWKRL